MQQTERTSPVVARSEIVIDAEVRHVWSVLAQIEQWPSWHPGVRGTELDGALETGTGFRYEAGPSTNTCVLTRVDAPWALAWRGHSMGVGHDRSWRLEEGSGACHVITEQSLSGILARLFSGRLLGWSQRELDIWVHLLKLEAESGRGKSDAYDDVDAALDAELR